MTEAARFEVAILGASAVALLPALVGTLLGGWARGRVSEAVFRRRFVLGLLALDLALPSRAVS